MGLIQEIQASLNRGESPEFIAKNKNIPLDWILKIWKPTLTDYQKRQKKQ